LGIEKTSKFEQAHIRRYGNPPSAAKLLLLSAQWSRRVAAGAAFLRSLAYWASASPHPALLSLGSAPFVKGAFGNLQPKGSFSKGAVAAGD
jgi:hypothetical protein